MNIHKKSGFVFLCIMLIALPVYLLAQSETIIINNTDTFKQKIRSSVNFPHMNHMTLEGVSCTDCHHRFENGKNVLDSDELTEDNKSILCSSCHTGKSSLEKAYHRQCIGCHDGKKSGKPAGPRMCGECHKRNK
ncbi:MAG: cytochrome c3 family protein [Spirochaetes bacterium]|nr:cytochrome c3 family protein [Spirochaetota bacterium]